MFVYHLPSSYVLLQLDLFSCVCGQKLIKNRKTQVWELKEKLIKTR